ncbi:MAG: hypothetical protein K9K88_04595 [Desulfobacterales bacterium]|nr:hypothetical protein [Desulfobacterales bacterium]
MVIVELVTNFALLIGGTVLVYTFGMRGWALPAFGYVTGIALMVILGGLQVVIAQPTTPVLTLCLTMLIPIAVWIWFHKKGSAPSFRILPALLFSLAAAAAIAGLYAVKLLNLTPDSYQYAQVGSLFESSRMELAQPSLLLKRTLAVPLLHAPANLADHFFLFSITPLLALATSVILAWFCQKGLQSGQVNWLTIWTLPICAALLLLANQFFIYNAFYVNGHILYCALLLLIAGGSWLYASNADIPKTALSCILFCAVPALVIARPEGGLQAGLVLLPVFVSEKFPVRLRALLAAVLGFSILVWNGFLWLKFSAAGQTAPISVIGMFWLGVLAVGFIPFLYSHFFGRFSFRFLSLAEITLWVALLATALREPEVFILSVNATIENVFMGAGLWGYSLVVLLLLFAGVLVITDTSDRIFLRFPVTTFIPFGLLLAHLRDLPYRIGAFDSFNRMILHVVPIAILFVVSSAGSRRREGLVKKPSYAGKAEQGVEK